MKQLNSKEITVINRAYEAAGREQNFYQHLMQRCYQSPKGYLNFEQCAAQWAGELIACRMGPIELSTQKSLLCLDGLVQQAIPSVYYITYELIELVEQTDIDLGLTLEDFNCFTECSLLFFPSHLFACEGANGISPDTYLTSFIFRRVELPYQLKFHPLKLPQNKMMRSMIEHSSYYNPSGEIMLQEQGSGTFDCLSAMDGNRETVHTLCSASLKISELVSEGQISARHQAAKRVLNFIHRLAAIISTNPSDFIHSAGQITGQTKGKGFGAKSQFSLWEATWLGLKGDGSEAFSATRQSTGVGRSPRPHFRRGHLRRQRYGEGRSKAKLIWIKPALVKAE